MGKYHIYRRGKVWQYWYWDEGKQVRKSTGYEKKSDAFDFIQQLEEADRTAAGTASEPVRVVTFREIADPMFRSGAAHLLRWARKNRGMKPSTVEQHRRWIDLFLLPRWGDTPLEKITTSDFENWLETLTGTASHRQDVLLSSSTLNCIIDTFNLVMGEAVRDKFLAVVPSIEPYKRRSQRKDSFLDAELEKLFPQCPVAMAAVWARTPKLKPRRPEPIEDGVMFGAMFALMVSAGLRPGEARALHVDQLYPDCGGLIVDRAIDVDGEIGPPKKSKEDAPRFRVSYVPERTWKSVNHWLKIRKESIEFPGLAFHYRGQPVTAGYLADRLNFALENVGIMKAGRILTPHSCRYTYNTKMKAVLSADVLREFIGHRTEAMTAHYDRATMRPALESRMLQLAGERSKVELFWEN